MKSAYLVPGVHPVEMPRVAVIGDDEVYTSNKKRYKAGTGFLGTVSAQAISTLTIGLAAYWPANTLDGVDIISGNIVNVIGGNAENQPGKIGNCWSPLVGGASIQEVTDTINIQFASSFTLACWILYQTSPTPGNGFMSLFGGIVRGYGISWSTASNYRFTIQSAISSKDIDLVGGVIVDGLWHRIVAYYDAIRQVIGIYKDNEVPVETSTAGFSYAAPLITDDLLLALLRNNIGNVVRIDEIGMWNRVWTASEKLEHWNNGAGLAYPFS